MNTLTESFYDKQPEITIPDVVEGDPSHKIAVVENTLCLMQTKLASIKQARQDREDLSILVQELSIKLAEAQANEAKATESLLELEIEWQELTQKLITYSDLNVSGD